MTDALLNPFYFATGDVRYPVSLHAWASKERISDGSVDRVIAFESGAALPHAIATLKTIVGSMDRGPAA